MRKAKFFTVAGAVGTVALAGAGAAHAAVEISNQPTLNMSCVGGVCTATADKARLNATDLANMLASGDVAVKTGSLTGDIQLKQPLGWTSGSRLTLDARRTVEIDKPMSVTGSGALTVVTDDGGSGGEFAIFPERGSVQFWDLNSSLIINGQTYTLVGDIKTLAADIAANPSGFYALAKDYDASADGTYSTSAIPGQFEGVFEGLGNIVSNFVLRYHPQIDPFGFFEQVGVQGAVRDFGLTNADVAGSDGLLGTLAGGNDGLIELCWARGKLANPNQGGGGLVSTNGGVISLSFAKVEISDTNSRYSGGLVAFNAGLISRSWSGAPVIVEMSVADAGGLVGYNEKGDGKIVDSFTTGGMRKSEKGSCCDFGGLVGSNGTGASIASTYAAGRMGWKSGGNYFVGGLIGEDDATPGSVSNSYWDTDKGVSDPSQGAGNVKNDPGITGLTTEQLQSGLPKGFNPDVWSIDPRKNHGFPYLRGLPSS